jgi:Peptidase family M28
MLPMSVDSAQPMLEGVLREVVETLAPIDRTPCTPGERQAAEWLATRMGRVPGVDVALEDEPSWGTFPPTTIGLGVAGMVAATLVLGGRRATGALLAAAGLACIVDEAQNGPRILRRLARRRRSTVNLVARAGEADAGKAEAGEVQSHGRDGDGEGIGQGTVVVLAHHDAPQTGLLFDQTLQRRLYELAPSLIERAKTPLPQWWIGIAGPLCTIAGAAGRHRGLARAGLAIGLLGTAIVTDVWRNPTVQGANDNLSGVAALVALAELLKERPLPGLRVLLVSCGAEETLQDGVRAFVARHRHELDPERTWFVNLDTIGSPHLVMLEAEGPVWMEEYAGPWLRDLLADCAQRLEIRLHRGYRARASTDSVIPSRAGYPTATLVSMTDWRSPANYHLPSDIPANLDYGTVAETTRLVYDVMRALAEDPGAAASLPPRS